MIENMEMVWYENRTTGTRWSPIGKMAGTRGTKVPEGKRINDSSQMEDFQSNANRQPKAPRPASRPAAVAP